jgi:hypothetical protein
MNQSSRSNFGVRANPLDDESHDIPAWVYALALGVLTIIEILR